jgi:ABC transport system ATP-binding/permease protein
MFPPAMQYTLVSKLSGGEQRRLYLLTVLIKNPNFLILDEPTNDLDLLTLNKLEEFLTGFGGCLILVTHDRYFMDMLVDHIFIFEGKGVVKDYNGTYTEYRVDLEEEEKLALAEKAKEQEIKNTAAKQKPEEKKRMNFKEKFEFDTIQKEMEALNKEKAKLEVEINSGIEDYVQIQKIADRISAIIELLDEKEMRWLELDELNN